MSDDEIIVMFACVVTCAITWGRWYWRTLSVNTLAHSHQDRLVIYLTPLFCIGVLFSVLVRFAAIDVRGDARYLFFYMAMGLAWTGVASSFLPLLDLSAREDVAERGNKAAGYAIAGALSGITLCFAGGNIGDGPGWWVVVFCALLSTATFFALWIFLEKWSGIAETITVERSRAAGARLAGFCLATGVVLGRAVAGDWKSVEATVADFVAIAWPVVFYVPVAVIGEKIFAPKSDHTDESFFVRGLVPFMIYLLTALFYVAGRSSW